MKSAPFFTLFVFTLILSACGGSPTENNEGNAAEKTPEKQKKGFSFDLGQHEISYAVANELIDNYCNSVIYQERPNGTPISVSRADFRVINMEDFQSAFPIDNEDSRTAIRITFGLDIRGNRLEYYLSPVKFGEIKENEAKESIVDFTPQDTVEGDSLKYLKSVPVFQIKADGRLVKIDTASNDWKVMLGYWTAYKKSIFFKDQSSAKYSAYNPNTSTRSVLIPTQVLYNLIESQKLKSLNVTSVLYFFEKEAKHSVVFSGIADSTLKIDKQLSNKALEELLDEFYTGCNGGKFPVKFKKPRMFKDLSPEEQAFIDLKLNKNSSAPFGMAANYAQLCPAKCLQLIGTIEPSQRVLRLKGMDR
jgi:hypothetical protein